MCALRGPPQPHSSVGDNVIYVSTDPEQDYDKCGIHAEVAATSHLVNRVSQLRVGIVQVRMQVVHLSAHLAVSPPHSGDTLHYNALYIEYATDE